ncbi:uncharacterized protein K460DRAFT_401590 [Cucurbitaria berberidis CBS 394.84]|uniref:Uncharacterized protein n=1 Tax=Cucurbitaria berberidis CBS 394.84 TaxID=1168544 RepID=A0A9P4GV42_9PLEO|nr:uncharacterized protein K460DRAFT_401590 [Cucurbitaria berberidis CBS 394.84]KAF1851576.1 hypothetical protein K460DRAFT_401590 [Cucurbitaria berberidis CBS 394.84]
MVSSPLPYDVRWTSKLIRRDIKDLKSKCVAKFKNMFTKAAKASIPSHPQDEKFEAAAGECESFERVAERSIPETASTEFPRSDSTNLRSSTATTAPTELTEEPETNSQKGFTTLYELLETKLKELYTSRERDLPDEERWKFRGSCLLLHMAIQACPSNDSYNIFREGKSAPDESKMLLELLQLGTAKACNIPGNKVSEMPAEPYTKRNSEHARYDSAFSTVSLGSLQPPNLTKPSKAPPPSQIWHTILQASTGHTKITSVAEDILTYVWPEKNAADILDQIGHPEKQFHEDSELRLQFRRILFPEYDALVKGSC